MRQYGTKRNPWPIAVTDLDSWLFYKHSESMPHERFMERMNRVQVWSMPAIVGTCFHNAIEHEMRNGGKYKPLDCIAGEGKWENQQGNTVSLRVQFYLHKSGEIQLPQYGFVEEDVSKVIDCEHGYVELRGKLDGAYGFTLVDLKTTSGVFQAEKYLDAMQWRAYFLAMGEQFNTFEYHVFRIEMNKDTKTLYDLHQVKNGVRRPFSLSGHVINHNVLRTHPYPEMENDVTACASELVSYLQKAKWRPSPKRAMEVF